MHANEKYESGKSRPVFGRVFLDALSGSPGHAQAAKSARNTNRRPFNGLATIDVDPSTPDYYRVTARITVPYVAGELPHFTN